MLDCHHPHQSRDADPYRHFLILFENLFKPRQRRLAVYMLLTSSVSSATSKQCFELTSSVLSTTSKQCFEQPAASFLVCSLIFIEYNTKGSPSATFSYASSIKRVCSLLIQRFITMSSHPPARKISSASRLSSPSCAQKILALAFRKSRATSGRNSLRR